MRRWLTTGEFEYSRLPYANLVTLMGNIPGVTITNQGASSNPSYNLRSLAVGPATGKPVMVVLGNTHGDEWQTVYWTLRFVQLVAGAIPNPQTRLFSYIRNNLRIIAVPCLNPHGYTVLSRNNANNVDLNRNYDWGWDEWSPDNPGEYGGPKGPYAFSEPETQLVKSLVETHRPVMLMDCHAEGSGEPRARIVQPHGRFLPGNRSVGIAMAEMGSVPNGPPIFGLDGNDGLRPLAAPWAGGQPTARGSLPMWTATFETPRQISNGEQAQQGCDGLVAFAVAAIQWATRRTLAPVRPPEDTGFVPWVDPARLIR